MLRLTGIASIARSSIARSRARLKRARVRFDPRLRFPRRGGTQAEGAQRLERAFQGAFAIRRLCSSGELALHF